jgi:DNA-binding SARP family transcriptional activator/predicted ATPase
MAARLEVTCLGEFTARLDGIALPALAGSKPLALWLYLASEGVPRSRAHLAEFFWGELGDEAARGNLRLALMRLRKLMPDHVEVGRDGVCVPAGCDYRIDRDEFPALADGAANGVEALVLWRPEEFLSGLRLRHAPAFDDWVTDQRQRLLDRYVGLLTDAAQLLTRAREPALAVQVLRRCLALVPWSEPHHRALIQCFADLGQRAAALAQLDSCRRALRAELDVEPGAETLALVRAINALPEPVPEVAPVWAPVPDDSQAPLVDRPDERLHIAGLLADPGCRLVSVVGPGGVGKTHLARQLGHALGDRFADGVVFVSLADVEPQRTGTALTLVEKRIAEALGLTGAGATRAALLEALARRNLLLILDNFEQLVAAAELLEAIALRAPEVRVLVTSRRRLGLATEWIVTLDGLAVPAGSSWDAAAAKSPALQLFAKVGERVVTAFDVASNGPDILRICRAVGGLPLAIIIAARWLSTLSCRQIADELEAGFALLDRPPGGGDDRLLQGISTVLDRSWALLGAEERAAFSGLGVFRGGFTAAAAREICGCSMAALDQLVCQSLVRNHGDGRLTVHELTRDYAGIKLGAEPGQLAVVQQAHAGYFAGLLAAELARFRRDPLNVAFDETRQELGNHIVALEYFLAAGDVARVVDQLEGLWCFHKRRGWFADGAVLLRRGLAMPDLALAPACRLRLWLSDACFQLGLHDEGKEAVLESLARAGETVPEERAGAFAAREVLRQLLPGDAAAIGADRAGLRDDLARTHNRLAQLYFFEGDRLRFLGSTLRSMSAAGASDAPEHWATGALALAHVPVRGLAARYARRAARTVGRAEPFARAWSHEQLALYYLGVGRFADAEFHAGQGAALFGALGQHKNWGESATLHTYPALFHGDLPEAGRRFTALVTTAREVREAFAEIWGICGLAHLALRTGGDPASAHAELTSLAPLLGRLVDPNTDILYHGNVAWLAARLGRTREALDAIAACRRVVANASMLSVYATNGFIGQAMALLELAAADQGPSAARLDGVAGPVLRDFARFARPFAACQPYRLYCEGRWLLARGHARRGQAMVARALATLPVPMDRAAFDAGFAASEA